MRRAERLEARDLLAVQPLPALAPLDPAGGLIYASTFAAVVDPGNPIQSYEVALDAGQSLSLSATGFSTANLTVVDPLGATIAATSVPAAGDAAAVSSLPIDLAGVYTISVSSGDGVPFDAITLSTVLNAAWEGESHSGPSNDSPAEAEDLEPAFAAVGPLTAQRAAIVGEGAASGPTFTASLTDYGRAFNPNVLTFAFTGTPAPLNDVVFKVVAQTDLDSASEYFTIDAEGLFTQNVFLTGGSQGGLSTDQFTIPQAVAAQLAADGQITLTVTPSSSVNSGYGSGDVTIDVD
ncbi:hypothetical protein Pla108_40250 [Botrimarina colliarenosi]|uniref:Peptidase C-terminal archaeal/bacterial domain-containing protein n=1 Tax=Botrimarina colliarenosi TaxID=2528001 RepID=A0A5C6A0G2_9BACT|nr:hypothetical protein [Botrimarina colliarenosi]TWT92885.1 hypothetical protein Pla108_40250 [Botrimarina colliarenosi]